MNATELFHQDGKTAAIFYCGKCRIVCRTREEAESCCVPVVCSVCAGTVRQYHTKCDACEESERQRKEAERFEKAEKVTSWVEYIYSEGHGFNEGYFTDLGEFEDWWASCRDEEDERPAYVWTCEPHPFCQLDIDHIIENATQEAYEDWDGFTDGYDALKAAIEAFNTANAKLISWTPNYKKALLLTCEVTE